MRIRTLISTAAVSAACLSAAAPAMAAPSNDDFNDAKSLGTGTSGWATFNTSGATQQLWEPDLFASGDGNTVWYTWTPAKSGGARVHVCGSTGAKVRVYTGPAVQALYDVPWGYSGTTGECDEEDLFMATAGTVYRIVVDHTKGESPTSGTVQVSQRTEKPAVTFPGWPKVSAPSLQSPLRTSTWDPALDPKSALFYCELDGKQVGCDENGPKLTGLAHGTHALSVVAYDSHGNVSDEDTKLWDVDAKGPFVQMPWIGTQTFPAPPVVEWTASEDGVKYLCTVDYGDPSPCSPGWQAPGAAARAREAGGDHPLASRAAC